MPNLHRLALLVATLKPLLHRFQVPIWSIAIAVSRPAKQGPCKCMTVKRIVRCFANSLNLVSNLIEFGQQIQWIYSAISMILPYCHDDIRALKNCCMSQTKVALLSKSICFAEQINLLCRANQFTLQRKSICFTEQINLLCIRIDRLFTRNICFSTYYTDVRNTVNNSPQARRQSWLFCGQTRGISATEVKFLCH